MAKPGVHVATVGAAVDAVGSGGVPMNNDGVHYVFPGGLAMLVLHMPLAVGLGGETEVANRAL